VAFENTRIVWGTAVLIAATMLEVLNQLPQAPGNKLPSVKLEVWLYKFSTNLSLHN